MLVLVLCWHISLYMFEVWGLSPSKMFAFEIFVLTMYTWALFWLNSSAFLPVCMSRYFTVTEIFPWGGKKKKQTINKVKIFWWTFTSVTFLWRCQVISIVKISIINSGKSLDNMYGFNFITHFISPTLFQGNGVYLNWTMWKL